MSPLGALRSLSQSLTDAFRTDEEADYVPDALMKPSRMPEFVKFSDLLPYLAYEETTRLFVLESAEADVPDAYGFVLEMVPQTGASMDMAELLTTTFSDLPPGSSVQWSLLGTPLIQEFLDDFVDSRRASEGGEQGSLHVVMAKRMANYFAKGATKPLFSSTPFMLRNYRLIMSVVVPVTDLRDKQRINEVVSIRESIATNLKTYYQYESEWTPEDLVNWCNVILNPQVSMRGLGVQHLHYDEGKRIKHQVVRPDTVMRVTESGLLYGMPQVEGTVKTRLFSVRSYPKAITLHAMGNLIGDAMQSSIGYSSPFMITVGIAVDNYEKARNKTQLRSARAQQRAESPMAKFMPQLAAVSQDWKLAQAAFDDGKGTCSLYHQVALFCTPENEKRAEQSAQAVWRTRQLELVEDRFMQLQALLGSLPMGLTPTLQNDIRRAQRWSTKTTRNAVNMAPLLGEWRGVGAPVVPLWGRRGQHMSIDVFGNTTGNYNGCVVGTSGSGKSVLLNLIALSYVGIGGRVWIMDVGGSYEKICKVLGGQYITFGPDSNISLNPFSMVNDIDEDIEMLVPLIEQMCAPTEPLGDYERRQLTLHIMSVWYTFGTSATIQDLAYSLINNCEMGGPNPLQADEEWLQTVRNMTREERAKICDPRIRDLGVQLFPFTQDGPYARFFDGPANIDFNSNYIVLELQELNSKPDLQAVVMCLLMYKITQDMYLKRDQKKVCIIDEAWALLKGNGAGFIETGYRRARKTRGAFFTGTQGVDEYFHSPAAEAALKNADWMFFMRQKPESIVALEKSGRLVVDEWMKEMLLSIKKQDGMYAEVFVTAGQMGQGIGRVMLDPFTLLLCSSSPDDYTAIMHYRGQGLSVEESVERVLRDRGFVLDDIEDAARSGEPTV